MCIRDRRAWVIVVDGGRPMRWGSDLALGASPPSEKGVGPPGKTGGIGEGQTARFGEHELALLVAVEAPPTFME